MKTVILKGVGVADTGLGLGLQSFELSHAQRILDLQRQNPPTSWKLEDPLYTLVNGIISELEPQS